MMLLLEAGMEGAPCVFQLKEKTKERRRENQTVSVFVFRLSVSPTVKATVA